MGVLNQFITTSILCFLCLTMGMMYTWPSSTLAIFSSANTTLDRTMSEGEIALLGSLSSVGALVSTPIAAYMLDKIGRKKCSISFSLVSVIGWALIAATNRVEMVLTGLFIAGLSSAAFIVNSVYLGEICQETIRGLMSSGITVFYGIGILISYLIGGFLEYWVIVYVNLSLTIIGTIGMCFITESPVYLMKRGWEEQAEKAIAFFRGEKVDSKEVQAEMDNIRRSLNPDLDDEASPEEEELRPEQKKKEKENLSVFQFIKKSRSSRRALIVATTMMTATIFQGITAVQVYADPLFAEAVPSMSSTRCSIILAIIMVGSGFLGAYLSDALGRRPLMIYGSVTAGVASVLLGSQIQVSWGPNWLTAVFIYMFAIFYTLGAGTVPYILASEVFLPEIKTFTNLIITEWSWICNFLLLFIFNILINSIGLGPVFYIFAAICFATTGIAIVYLPETKGLTVDAIQLEFIPKKRR